MPAPPFLSHKRDDAAQLEILRGELCLRGAGGWQDVHELRLGQRWKQAFIRAIGRDTGGFIWWGTRKTLASRMICKVEIPRALRRASRRRGTPYPVVPLFVDISPNDDRVEIERALARPLVIPKATALSGQRRAAKLLALQGVRKGKSESVHAFARRAARRYVRDLVRSHPTDKALRVAITGEREPTYTHDLSLDWRSLLDDGRAEPAAIPVLIETVAEIRTAAQASNAIPKIELEVHLRLPLAALVGWEWNTARPVDLTVIQSSTQGRWIVPEKPPSDFPLPDPVITTLTGAGPAVVAVSTGKELGDTPLRYADQLQAGKLIQLHVAMPLGFLTGDEIAGVARWTADRLAELNAQGLDKHLLLLGPASLAARIGANASGTGKTFIPFWDGRYGYTSGVTIG